MTKSDFVKILKQHAIDIRAANSGGVGSEPGWHAADVLDYVANNLDEIARRQDGPLRGGFDHKRGRFGRIGT